MKTNTAVLSRHNVPSSTVPPLSSSTVIFARSSARVSMLRLYSFRLYHRGMRLWIGCVLLIGCNQVWGLDPTTEAAPIDRDEDGVEDIEDNCPTIPNDQADDDNDGYGNKCDSCPQLSDVPH